MDAVWTWSKCVAAEGAVTVAAWSLGVAGKVIGNEVTPIGASRLLDPRDADGAAPRPEWSLKSLYGDTSADYLV